MINNQVALPSINYTRAHQRANLHSENYTMPNKLSSQLDPESWFGFRGGSTHNSYNKGGNNDDQHGNSNGGYGCTNAG